MKIAVFGAGAIGGYLASKLHQAGENVSIVARGDHLAAIRSKGLTVKSAGQTFNAAIRATNQAAELGVQARLFVATKVWTSGKQSGIRQMEDSMKKLRVERLDLIQVHNLVDVSTHLATLRDWKASGRIRYLGVTHYHAGAHADLEKVIARGDVDFVQVNYSLVEPETERRLLRVAADTRTAVIVNRPFAEGAIFRRTKTQPVPEWAKDIGCASWAQFSLKWILAEPAVTCVIPGTRNPAHAADNMGAATGPLPDPATRAKMTAHFASL